MSTFQKADTETLIALVKAEFRGCDFDIGTFIKNERLDGNTLLALTKADLRAAGLPLGLAVKLYAWAISENKKTQVVDRCSENLQVVDGGLEEDGASLARTRPLSRRPTRTSNQNSEEGGASLATSLLSHEPTRTIDQNSEEDGASLATRLVSCEPTCINQYSEEEEDGASISCSRLLSRKPVGSCFRIITLPWFPRRKSGLVGCLESSRSLNGKEEKPLGTPFVRSSRMQRQKESGGTGMLCVGWRVRRFRA